MREGLRNFLTHLVPRGCMLILMDNARAMCVLFFGICCITSGCRSVGPTAAPTSDETRQFHAESFVVLRVATESLARLGYSTYDGNRDMVVGSRSRPTAAAPLTTAAGVIFFPIGLAAGVAISPVAPQGPMLALKSISIADAGYDTREIYVHAVPGTNGTARVRIRGSNAADIQSIWRDLEAPLGASSLDLGPPLVWQR